MPIDSSEFPVWMWATSVGLIAASLGLLLFALRKPKPAATMQPPAEIPTPAEPPPPPPLPVAPQPLAPYNRASERRVGYRRVGNPVEVLICDAEFKEPPIRGWVVDRSRMGVRLSLNVKHANGTILQIRPTTSPEIVPWQSIQVKNAQPNDQSWELGCQFTSEPSWEVLLLFG